MANTTSSTISSAIGRSLEADQIYQQYIACTQDVDAKIHAIDGLPYATRSTPAALVARSTLQALKLELFPIYTANYNNPIATLSDFKAASSATTAKIQSTFNNAMGGEPASASSSSSSSSATLVIPSAPPSVSSSSSSATSHSTTASASSGAVWNPTLTALQAEGIELATWLVDWTSFQYPVPQGVNTVNIFVGNMHLDSNGTPVIDGFGNLSVPYNDRTPAYKIMNDFIAACHAQNIAVKISIGGGGGSYDHCWDILTRDNVEHVAKALSQFCIQHHIDGVDFDYEGTTSHKSGPEQQALVGKLIKAFKAENPTYLTSLCTNAGYGPNYQWPAIVDNILDNASDESKNCAVDRLYIMSYYNTLEEEKGWINGWFEMARSKYHFSPSQITVGLNNVDAHAYDISAFTRWAKERGFSVSYWMYNPAQPRTSDQSTNEIFRAYTG